MQKSPILPTSRILTKAGYSSDAAILSKCTENIREYFKCFPLPSVDAAVILRGCALSVHVSYPDV